MTLLGCARLRSVSLVALFALALQASTAWSQNCTGTISTDISLVSASSGGVQNLQLSVAPSQSQLPWQVIGSFGSDLPHPVWVHAGLRLNSDRYLWRMYTGHVGFVQGGIEGFVGGPLVPFDAQGHAQLQVVIPAGLPSSFIGRTLYHGMYRTSHLTLLPECGTGTVALTIAP